MTKRFLTRHIRLTAEAPTLPQDGKFRQSQAVVAAATVRCIQLGNSPARERPADHSLELSVTTGRITATLWGKPAMIQKWSEGFADDNMSEDILTDLAETIERRP